MNVGIRDLYFDGNIRDFWVYFFDFFIVCIMELWLVLFMLLFKVKYFNGRKGISILSVFCLLYYIILDKYIVFCFF